MARKFREPVPVEPAIFDREHTAWRYRFLTRWLMLTDLGLTAAEVDSVPAWDADGTPAALRKLEEQIDAWGLRDQAERFIRHLLDARARWPSGGH